MNSLILYLLKSTVVLSIFTVFYYFTLRKETFHHLKRYFLLLIPFVAFAFPLLKFSVPTEQVLVTTLIEEVSIVSSDRIINTSPAITWNNILSTLFYMGGCLLLLYFIGGMIQLFTLLSKTIKRTLNIGVLAITKEDISPFSFLKYIVINIDRHTQEEVDQIVHHEQVHIAGMHSFDALLAQFVLLLSWFNPMAWLYKHLVMENLEFIADSEVLKTSEIDKKAYQLSLINTAFYNNSMVFANHFNQLLIKKRIAMMNKQLSKPKNLFKTVFVLPILLLLLVVSGQLRANQQTTILANEVVDDSTRIDYFIDGQAVTMDFIQDAYEGQIEGYTAISEQHDDGSQELRVYTSKETYASGPDFDPALEILTDEGIIEHPNVVLIQEPLDERFFIDDKAVTAQEFERHAASAECYKRWSWTYKQEDKNMKVTYCWTTETAYANRKSDAYYEDRFGITIPPPPPPPAPREGAVPAPPAPPAPPSSAGLPAPPPPPPPPPPMTFNEVINEDYEEIWIDGEKAAEEVLQQLEKSEIENIDISFKNNKKIIRVITKDIAGINELLNSGDAEIKIDGRNATISEFRALPTSEIETVSVKKTLGVNSIRVSTKSQQVQVVAEVMPEYPGGLNALRKEVGKKFNVPKSMTESGKVTCRFIIEKDGRVGTVEILRNTANEEAAIEAERVLKSLDHKFTPAEEGGKKVRTWFILPIDIALGNSDNTQNSSKTHRMPEYPGGMAAFRKEIAEKYVVPKSFQGNQKLMCEFVVLESGDVGDVNILLSVSEEADANAIKVLKNLDHKFIPAMKDGKAVRMKLTVPFRVTTTKSTTASYIREGYSGYMVNDNVVFEMQGYMHRSEGSSFIVPTSWKKQKLEQAISNKDYDVLFVRIKENRALLTKEGLPTEEVKRIENPKRLIRVIHV